ncbi:MAG: hydantoinase/carbamoylase family amidase, partial [Betaproteobacteria bacterium]
HEQQLALIKAHPLLTVEPAAGLTPEAQTGLWQATPTQASQLKALNNAYLARFDWPFVIDVRGPRGQGLTPQTMLNELSRRLHASTSVEFAECLRQIHRMAETRLNDKSHTYPVTGAEVWDWHEWLAQFSDPGFAEKGELSVSYLTHAHQACAQTLVLGMRACGFDEVCIDAVGNVVGRYHPARPGARYVLTGSHYDTVRNGGKYDGRLGIFVPMACVRELVREGKRLNIGLEVVAFAEEEGQRYKATFLASSALTGSFRQEWLNQIDADGVSMRQAMQQAGLNPADIPAIQRDPSNYLGFVEVHIEQGPVLQSLNLPLGVVTSINGSVRYLIEISGTASHAGTSPMNQRQDAAAGFAEWAVYVEERARADGDSVATVGMLNVPQGSINVVPGNCHFSLDMRAPTDAQRDAMAQDILKQLTAVCEKRGLQFRLEETVRAAAAPSDTGLQQRWEAVVQALGLPVHRMPSGAGHDAMKLHDLMPQAMLFVRGENQGISHNPLECTTADDIQLAIQAFSLLMKKFST